MEVIARFQPNEKTSRGLDKLPSDTLYAVAKNTLDLTISREFIPRKTGATQIGSAAVGVRGSGNDYYIGSWTRYASYVWKMKQNETNWTNPHSKSQWYAYTLKRYGTQIIDNAVNKAWKEDM